MNRPVRVVLVANANIKFKTLMRIVEQHIKNGKSSSEEMKLLNSIKQKLDFIRYDMFYGDGIHKNLIPKSYNVRCLWRVELCFFWRMLYTILTKKVIQPVWS